MTLYTARVYRLERSPERWEPDGYHMRMVFPVQLVEEGFDHTGTTPDEAMRFARVDAERRTKLNPSHTYTILEVINP